MINKVILMGRLTRDPEVRTTNTGRPVCTFTVAVDRGYGENRQTDFITCVAWQNQAEFLGKYFTKGMMIIVSGRISTRSWDGQDGKKNYVTEVVANEISFGETKKSREATGYSAPQQNSYNSNSYNNSSYSNSGSYSAPKPAPQTSMPSGIESEEFVPISEIDDDLPF